MSYRVQPTSYIGSGEPGEWLLIHGHSTARTVIASFSTEDAATVALDMVNDAETNNTPHMAWIADLTITENQQYATVLTADVVDIIRAVAGGAYDVLSLLRPDLDIRTKNIEYAFYRYAYSHKSTRHDIMANSNTILAQLITDRAHYLGKEIPVVPPF